jgi:hypothetical protein
VDGHERADVVQYRQEVFLPAFEEIRPFLVTWDDEGQIVMPQNLPPGQKPLVLVTLDESTFNANDGKRELWMEDGKQPLRPKARGKGLMISDFLTPGGRLAVPDAISDTELTDLRQLSTASARSMSQTKWAIPTEKCTVGAGAVYIAHLCFPVHNRLVRSFSAYPSLKSDQSCESLLCRNDSECGCCNGPTLGRGYILYMRGRFVWGKAWGRPCLWRSAEAIIGFRSRSLDS